MLKLFISLFILPTAAFAQNSTQAPESGFMSFLPLILIFIIFYFLLIRPQQKKHKEHQDMVGGLKVNDNVCTQSGIIGKIVKIDNKENLVHLEVSKDVVITILKASVNNVLDSKKLAKLKQDTAPKTKSKKSKK